MSNDVIENFMGIFPNAASPEYCERCLTRFNFIQDGRGTGQGIILSRQDINGNTDRIDKDSDVYNIGGVLEKNTGLTDEDHIILNQDTGLIREYSLIAGNCYEKYRKKYGILDNMHKHKLSPYVKIQRYKPGQGYHVWHCDNDSMSNSNRIIVVALYLNTVEEGGETEFLYQGIRVKPEQGTMTLIPAYYTHAHRGNPPLSGDKYYMNTWLELIE